MERGARRLKGSGGALGAGKRNKKVKDKAQILEQITSSKKQQQEEKCGLDKQTRAQVAFEKTQKQQVEQVLKKTSKPHKQRVEELSRHLDALTEHYDTPKVSWTK